MGYSPWGHQKSDMTEHTHTRERTQEHEMSGCGIKYHFGGSTQLQISQNTVFLIIVLFYESKNPIVCGHPTGSGFTFIQVILTFKRNRKTRLFKLHQSSLTSGSDGELSYTPSMVFHDLSLQVNICGNT